MATTAHPAALPCPLQWIWNPNTIPLRMKALVVVEILRDLRLSPVELLITLLGRQAEYKDNTHREMNVLSTIILQSTNDITPEGLLDFDFERDVTAVCEEHSPMLRRVLMAAAQTVRAAHENTLKDPAPVMLSHCTY
ncbi:hypothetical protein B0H13DRAFT_2306030 [Mycena leptocephala]|nr:hypothetical protein B0H13DRAFT_2306030 [Mycena leptocephala]